MTALEQRLRPARLKAASGTGPLVAVLGDSYAEGLDSPEPMTTFPYLLGAGRVAVDAIGGSGYDNPGPCGGARFSQRIRRVLEEHPNELIVEGGLNDEKATRFDTEVRGVFNAIRADPPRRVVIVGPYSPQPTDRALVAPLDRTLRLEAARYGFQYVSLSGLQLPLLSDKKHPTPAGQRLIAAAITPVLR